MSVARIRELKREIEQIENQMELALLHHDDTHYLAMEAKHAAVEAEYCAMFHVSVGEVTL